MIRFVRAIRPWAILTLALLLQPWPSVNAKVAIIRAPVAPAATEPTPSPHVLKLTGVALATFSPDGRVLMTVADADKQVHFWDLGTGEEVNRFGVAVTGAVFSGDATRVLTWGDDCVVRVFDTRTGKALRRLQNFNDPIRCAALSPDGHRALTSAEGSPRLQFWDAASGELLRTLDAGASTSTMIVFSADGKLAASLSGKMPELALVAPGVPPAKQASEIALRIWNLETLKLVRKIDLPSPGQACAFSKNGKLVMVTRNKVATIFDVATGQEVTAPRSADEIFDAGALTADRKLGLRSSIGAASLISAGSGEIIRALEGPIDGLPLCHAFSQSGERVILGTGKVKLFSRKANEPGKVYVYEVASGKRIADFDGHAREVTQVVFSPDARHAFSRDAAKTLFLWSLRQ